MPSITKSPKGYRAQVFVKGERASATFRTKREADAWAAAKETAIRMKVTTPTSSRVTFGELLRKYAKDVSAGKRGARWEAVRITAMLSDDALDTGAKLSDLTSESLGKWRNHRLTQVAPGTVLRELGLLSSVLEHARRELKWIPLNPLADVKRPPAPDHRRILISRPEVRAMLVSMGYNKRRCDSVTQACALAFLLALRTGMRQGELCGLKWSSVFSDYCKTSGKNAAATRDVPLTPKAKAIIERMRGFDSTLVFGIKSQTLDALFRRYRQRAGLSGFTFHDSRHTAATWIARQLHLLDLCIMFGWSNTKHALIYYNAPASDIAKQLSRPKPGQSR